MKTNQTRAFVTIETAEGRKTRLVVRYFNRHGIQLEEAPVYLQHNSEVTVTFEYFMDNRLHFLRTNALVERNQSRGIALSFQIGSKAIEVAKRLSRNTHIQGGLQQFHASQIASTHTLQNY